MIMYIDYSTDLSDLADWIIKGEDDPSASREKFCQLLSDRIAKYYNLDPSYINITDRAGDERLTVEDELFIDITAQERPFIENIEGELFASYEWVVSLTA